MELKWLEGSFRKGISSERLASQFSFLRFISGEVGVKVE